MVAVANSNITEMTKELARAAKSDVDKSQRVAKQMKNLDASGAARGWLNELKGRNSVVIGHIPVRYRRNS